jgi:hypothetical protein
MRLPGDMTSDAPAHQGRCDDRARRFAWCCWSSWSPWRSPRANRIPSTGRRAPHRLVPRSLSFPSAVLALRTPGTHSFLAHRSSQGPPVNGVKKRLTAIRKDDQDDMQVLPKATKQQAAEDLTQAFLSNHRRET